MPTLFPSSSSLEYCKRFWVESHFLKMITGGKKKLIWIMVKIQFSCLAAQSPSENTKWKVKKSRDFSIWCAVTVTIDHRCPHTQTLSHMFTCYELERTVVSRWISSDSFLDVVGCQVKQIQVIVHRETFLEAIFETDITCTKAPSYTKTCLIKLIDCFAINLREGMILLKPPLGNRTIFCLHK